MFKKDYMDNKKKIDKLMICYYRKEVIKQLN